MRCVNCASPTAIFSIVEGVLLRPLPFPNQAGLATLGDRLEGVEYGADSPGVTPHGIRTYITPENDSNEILTP